MVNLSSKIEAVSSLVLAVNALSNKTDNLKQAVIAGFDKIDNDSTDTNGDNDYKSTILALINN